MTQSSRITNTTAETRANPLGFLAASAGPGGPAQAIEEQERAGQRELVNSDLLPTQVQGNVEDFIDLGFVFGDTVAGDPMFQIANLPPGWKREGSDHDMWSYIVDERGIRRVAIFYKAAFYDRSAFMRLQSVGGSLATDFIYGAAPEPTLHPDLTADELADARTSVEAWLNEAARHPDIYADRAPRAEALVAAIDNARSES